MDLTQLNAQLRDSLGTDLNEEEQKAFLEIAKQNLQPKLKTDLLVEKMQELGIEDDKRTRDLIKNAQTIANLWLLRHWIDVTTEKERNAVEKSIKALSPMQSAALISQIFEKKTGKTLEKITQDLWHKVVDAYIHDIDLIVEAGENNK
jgi:hypothetical protein